VVRQSNVGNPKRRRRAGLIRPRAWPVAAKLVGLCVGVATVVAIGLTTLGYTLASAGLKQQAEAALYSDGLLIANQVNGWNARSLSDIQSLAALPAVRRTLEAGPAADPADVRAAQDALDIVRAAGEDVLSISILDDGGTIVLSTLPPNVG
jgi:hypothetical protein